MKRERRHELQHNDLAEWILKGYERILPYRNAIVGVALLAIVLIVSLMLWQSRAAAQAGEAWNSLGIPVFQPQFLDDRTIGEMQKAIATHSGTPAAEWAEVFAGDAELAIGTNKIITDKKIGIEFLTRALDRYTKAVDTLTIPAAKEQAMFGKARALESLIQNKEQVAKAVAAYEELNEKFPHGMFKPVVEQQIERLKKNDSLMFYEALAQYAPKPKVESPRSQLGKLGALPENPPGEPIPTTPARPKGSQSGATLGLPEPTLTPTEPAKPNAPKAEAPKAETPKTEPAKPQAVKPDDLKPDAPKSESLKPDAAKTEAPKSDAAKPDAAKKDK